eukprot:scaffold209713_cov19-Tisochrysis_lutea.AAC.1
MGAAHPAATLESRAAVDLSSYSSRVKLQHGGKRHCAARWWAGADAGGGVASAASCATRASTF